MRTYLILACIPICSITNGQSALPPFGEYSSEEISLKECTFDKNAEAVVLLDEATCEHDDEYGLLTRRRTRIKILNQREVERGNITIYFYSNDKGSNYETIGEIRGVSFDPESRQLSYLDKKSIFTTKENNKWSSVKFALPNVKAGAIIEYEYRSRWKSFHEPPDWLFQNDIPTVKSCFLYTILPIAEFTYSVQKKPSYPIVVKPMSTEGKIYFEMNNVPGLKSKPYMDAVKDYLQKVEFQLAGYANQRGGGFTKTNQTWKDLAYELITDREFGGVIRKDLPNMIEIKSIVAKETSDQDKVAAIYNYVRNNLTWTGIYSKFATDGLKGPWEKRRGNSGEINLILLSLLQSFNIDVYPLLVAERDYGKIDTTYPFLDRFNKVVAYAKAGGQTFILDATEKYTPPGLVPYPLLNTIGFIVDKKDFNLVRILNKKSSYNNVITLTARLDNSGLLKGTAEIKSSGYAKQIRTENIKTDPKNFNQKVLQDEGSALVVDNCSFENLDDDGKPLIQNVEFHNELNESGGFIFLIPNLFTYFTKNPFTAENRFTNINFGYPYDVSLEATIELPANSKIDNLPEDKYRQFRNNAITVSRKFKLENNKLIASISFSRSETLVVADQYPNLKSTYKQIIDLLNEPVLVKISQ